MRNAQPPIPADTFRFRDNTVQVRCLSVPCDPGLCLTTHTRPGPSSGVPYRFRGTRSTTATRFRKHRPDFSMPRLFLPAFPHSCIPCPTATTYFYRVRRCHLRIDARVRAGPDDVLRSRNRGPSEFDLIVPRLRTRVTQVDSIRDHRPRPRLRCRRLPFLVSLRQRESCPERRGLDTVTGDPNRPAGGRHTET